MLKGPARLLRHIDLALFQPLDQIVGREVDQLDIVGPVEDRVGHRLAHADARDLRHDVVEAFDVLDVEGGVDVDAVGEQLLDIEIALGMAAAGRVGMGELVDQSELWAPGEQRVEVHLLERAPLIVDGAAGDDLEALQQRFGLGAPVGLDHAATTSTPSFSLARASCSIS